MVWKEVGEMPADDVSKTRLKQIENPFVDTMLAVFWLSMKVILIIIFLQYLFGSVVFMYMKATTEEIRKVSLSKNETEKSLALFKLAPETAVFDIRKDYSVFIYVDKSRWENIPFLYRDSAMESIGKSWCGTKKAEVRENGYSPKVVIKDQKTGGNLDSFRCWTILDQG